MHHNTMKHAGKLQAQERLGPLCQICWAYRGEGGRTVVVLCAREKLDMETTFRRVMPESSHYGSRFVFRHVSDVLLLRPSLHAG